MATTIDLDFWEHRVSLIHSWTNHVGEPGTVQLNIEDVFVETGPAGDRGGPGELCLTVLPLFDRLGHSEGSGHLMERPFAVAVVQVQVQLGNPDHLSGSVLLHLLGFSSFLKHCLFRAGILVAAECAENGLGFGPFQN